MHCRRWHMWRQRRHQRDPQQVFDSAAEETEGGFQSKFRTVGCPAHTSLGNCTTRVVRCAGWDMSGYRLQTLSPTPSEIDAAEAAEREARELGPSEPIVSA